jgi:predicted phosphodiesterase
VTLTKGPILIFPGNNTQMQVSWQWSSATTFQVQWGTDQNYGLGNASVTAYDATNRLYKYVMSGLNPGTRYYYQVVVGSQCARGTFYAAPSSSATSLKFFSYGDTRTNGATHNSIAGKLIANYTADPAFQTLSLHVGDWVNSDGESNWTGEWFNQANVRTLTANIAYMGVRGNHEGSNSTYWKRYWPQPYQPGGLYMSFDYGPMHVVMLDQYTAYNAGSTQYNWLRNELATSTKAWKVIVLHEPGWSAGGGHGNNSTVQNDIQPLAEQYGVSIIFGGHNHYYARATVNGVQHLTVGGGGAPLYTPASGQPNIVKTSKADSWGQFVINGNTLTATIYNNSGGVIETFTLTK